MLKELIKKQVEFNFSKQKLVFDLNQSLFSSFDVDEGTKILLNSLRKSEINYGRILDLGCGHGVMGIFLKKKNPDSEVHCVDRDLLAIDFTKHNAQLNNCEVQAYPSLDYSDVKGKFNLIVCNFPAKAGLNALKKFVCGASKHLESDGRFCLVIVRELERDFKKILRDEIKIELEEKKAGYFIYHLSFEKELNVEEDSYFRNEVEYNLSNKKYKLKTAFGIPEFDSTHYTTDCVLKIVKKLDARNVFVVNPFQGHLAIGVAHYLKLKKITLISRDLLSLKYSQENLSANQIGSEIIHTSNLESGGDVLIWRLDKDDNSKFIEKKVVDYSKKFNWMVVAGDKKEIQKVAKKNNPVKDFSLGKFMAILLKNRR